MKKIAIVILMLMSTATWAETMIPRSMPGDKGKYYLIEMKREGNIVKALHKRVGVDTVGFTRTESNCATGQIRDMGYGEGSIASVKMYSANMQNWYDVSQGSSKSDLYRFVCLK